MSESLDADELFRHAFGMLAREVREEAGFLSPDSLYDAVAAALQDDVGQGNPQAILHLENGLGWIHPGVFTELLRGCGRPDADALGNAYATLKSTVNGKSEKTYRDRKRRNKNLYQTSALGK